jgi:hypothetical protein
MTPLETKLIDCGNILARSLGHRLGGCPKASPAVPCTCGAGPQQAAALVEWQRLMEQVKES